MRDLGLSVLEQYDLTAKSTYRGRGALICDTQQGLVMIKEFKGSLPRLKGQKQLLDLVENAGKVKTDCILSNTQGELTSTDEEGDSYYVKRWIEAKECDVKSENHILKSVRIMAALHNGMHMPVDPEYKRESLVEEYTRHTRELRKIQKFIRRKQKKNEFEYCYLDSVEWYVRQAEDTIEKLAGFSYAALRERADQGGQICHGDFNQHNVLTGNMQMAVVNFDKWNYDCQMADLYQFIRKIMEKNEWNIQLGKKMLETYHKEKPITEQEIQYLRLQFSYPEKYWKLANYYYNSNKAWSSWKNTEKLAAVIWQKTLWISFLKSDFFDFLFS